MGRVLHELIYYFVGIIYDLILQQDSIIVSSKRRRIESIINLTRYSTVLQTHAHNIIRYDTIVYFRDQNKLLL